MIGRSNGFELFNLTSPPIRKVNEGQIRGVGGTKHLREVGEMRFVAIDIQLPSGLANPAITNEFDQMSWKWAEVGPAEGSP